MLVTVQLPSGNKAIYRADGLDLDPQVVREQGTQVAHSFEGLWFFPGGWIRVPDAQAAQLLNQTVEITS